MTTPTDLTIPTPNLSAKQASQAKLINAILGACQQATACTTIEVLGALETVKSDIAVGMALSRRGQAAAVPKGN